MAFEFSGINANNNIVDLSAGYNEDAGMLRSIERFDGTAWSAVSEVALVEPKVLVALLSSAIMQFFYNNKNLFFTYTFIFSRTHAGCLSLSTTPP